MKQKVSGYWELALVAATTILFTFTNSLHVFTELLKNKPGYDFNAIVHSYPDYFLYLSHVAQGAAGKLIFTDFQFTNEPLPHTTIYWLYSFIGYAGHIVGISVPWSYNISLLLLVAVTVILWYVLCRTLFPTNRAYRLTTWLVVLSASPFFDMQAFLTRGSVVLSNDLWFSPSPAFNRLGGVPHQVAQIILLLLVMLAFAKAATFKRYTAKNTGFIVLIMITSFITTYAHAIQMALLIIAAGMSALLTMLRERKIDPERLIPVVAAGLASIPAALIVNQEFTIPVYAVVKNWELLQYSPTGLAWWIMILGPIVFFIPFGIWPFLKKADPLRQIFFFYGLICFIGYNSPVPRLLGVIPQRFLHPASYALFPILGTIGFFAVRKDLGHMIRQTSVARVVQMLFLLGALLFYAAYTIPADAAEVTMRINDPNLAVASPLNHVPATTVLALRSIPAMPYNPDSPVVIADGSLGIDLLIPLYTGRTSFLGESTHTLYPGDKENLRQRFFSGQMNKVEAVQFFRNHRVGYVIGTGLTQPILKNYPELVQEFRNNAMIIYIVRK